MNRYTVRHGCDSNGVDFIDDAIVRICDYDDIYEFSDGRVVVERKLIEHADGYIAEKIESIRVCAEEKKGSGCETLYESSD